MKKKKTIKKKKPRSCRPTYRISQAGRLLTLERDSDAGHTLSTAGKRHKQQRLKRGCLNGTKGVFRLTEKQKKKLPKALQKAILNHHKKLGEKIVD